MAFENVFRGIDFQAPNRAAMADQQMLMQALGQGIGSFEREQDRELQQRQLAQKAEAAKAKAAGNFEQVAMEELNRINLGGEPTPQGQAALKVMGQTSKPTVSVDEFGNRMVSPSPWQSLLGGAPPAQPQMQTTQLDPMQASEDAIRAQQVEIGANQHQRPELQPEQFKVQGVMAGTPAGEKIEQGVSADIFKEKAKEKISESKAEREFQLKKQRKRPQEERNLYNAAQEYGVVDNLIDKAIGQTTGWTTGIAGQIGSMLPATAATDMRATLGSIKADKMLSRLVELKKEGGTLGALAQKEQEALENSLASLDANQSPEQLTEGLNRYRQQRKSSVERVFRAYEDDYGSVPQDIKDMFGGITAEKVDYKSKYGLE